LQRLAIIADDLTGASDSGVQFTRKGLHSQVIFDWTGVSNESSLLDTIVIDTDSRSIPAENAYSRVKSAAETLKKQGYQLIYKKMDSTLRGNLGQELNAVLDVYGFEAAIIVPAFPRIGRTTVNGIHYLNGIPIHETEIAKDPKTPVTESNIAKLMTSKSSRNVVSVDLLTLREGEEAVRLRIQEALGPDAPFIIFDAETDDDLRLIANLVPVYGTRFLWGGSAGLAEYFPVNAVGNKKNQPQRNINGSKQVMLEAGSISKITSEQVMFVNRQPGVAAVEVDSIAILSGPDQLHDEVERCYKSLKEALDKGMDLSLYTDSAPDQVQFAKDLGSSVGLDPANVSNRIADALGHITSKVVSEFRLAGLVLTGGDTAKAVCRHLGVHGIDLIAELETGIPYGRLLGTENLMAVTKAGAFGKRESLRHAMRILKGEISYV
jgi:D-threonate/D-erythronate kinase